MKALLFYGPNEYELKEIEAPKITSSQILLKVEAAAICGSDMRMIANGYKGVSRETPRIYGHEIAGTIAEIGADVKGSYKVGDRIAIAPNMGCGQCNFCASGNTHLCAEYKALGINLDGGFAEYTVIPEAAIAQGNIVKLAPDMSFEKASVIEPLSCVYNGFEHVFVRPGDSVLVIGAGPIGILHAMLAKTAGASKVILSDLNENRLNMAKSVDPSFITCSGDIKDFIFDITGGEGVNVCITACPAPEAQASSLDLLSMNGRVCFFGGLPASKAEVALNTNTIHYKQLTVTGSTRANLDQYRKCVRLVESGALDLDKIMAVSKTFTLDQYEEAFEAAKAGTYLKNIFVF